MITLPRTLWLLPLTIPYWIFLQHRPGPPHLELASLRPLGYALLSLAGLLPAAWWIFRFDEDDRLRSLSRIGLGSCGGIALVYLFALAGSGPGIMGKFFGWPAALLFGAMNTGHLLKDVPELPLWVSIVGYTLGVGLSEELAKAITARLDGFEALRTRAGLGFVAGLGFGIGEAVIYSYRDYAGSADWTTYLIRFCFCAGFHGAMSAVAVLCLPMNWREQKLRVLLGLLPIAFLHGAYDALLVRQHPVWAGVAALAVFLILPSLLWVQEELLGDT